MEIKTIKVSLNTWKKLMKCKTELEYKNLNEVIEKLLNENGKQRIKDK